MITELQIDENVPVAILKRGANGLRQTTTRYTKFLLPYRIHIASFSWRTTEVSGFFFWVVSIYTHVRIS